MGTPSAEDFITVGSFPALIDLALIEADLREEGILYRILDGHTVSAAPHLSPAIGGARLQVRRMDQERTIWLLAERGIGIELEHQGSELFEWFDERTSGWPVVGRIPAASRFMLLAVILIVCVVLPVLFWSAGE